MRQRRVVTLLASTALLALTPGCATQNPSAAVSPTDSEASSAAVAGKLTGTWHGWFTYVGGSDGHETGDMTLVIKDDATYKLISTRWGRADVRGAGNDSGVVVANDRSVTLKSSSGAQWITLMRKGDTLYGVTRASSGRTIQIDMERTSRVPETP
jgi:hypothetical protein